MSTVYSPTPVVLGDITIPADGDEVDAVSVNVAFEALADGIEYNGDAIDTEAARAIAAEALLQPGRYLGTTLLTSASANFTTTASTRKIKIRGVGPGGPGGGCTSVGSAAGAGGGGGAGGYAEKTFTVTPSTAYAYTCGQTVGVNSTFIVGATTVTASAGGAGNTATSSANVTTTLGGTPGGGTNGDVNAQGEFGHAGFVTLVATPVGVGGQGGSGPFGSGGVHKLSAGDGNAATGYGAGGGGALTGASAARTGGALAPGCWVVEEFT